MRRVLSTLLLLLFSFPLIAPAFARSAGSNLPACCRRNGAHHCTGMSLTDSGPTLTSIRTRCPRYPTAAVTAQTHPANLDRSDARFAGITSDPSAPPQVETRYRIAFSRSRQKRGPPILLV